ncbi:hypothetical protein [Glycomyces salinus]|uniref:hypothetical protein n=1 Tax=Glycomyces salinus TaxID=980294 RepID=UPI0018ED9F48|nr:hypothetical protein [Glycomyces salinus]
MGASGRMAAGLLALCAALAGCDADSAESQDTDDRGHVYGVGDDHALWRWEVGSDAPERILDLSGVWEHEGDVGRVLTASLSVDPTGSRASWIAGGSENSTLMIGDLETGEATEAVDYPLDHACLDPAWLADGSALLAHRAAVWSEDGMVVEDFGPTEWYSRDGEPLPGAVELEPGCRLRWYTGEDGAAEGLYRDLAVTELYRVDDEGKRIETIALAGLGGVEPPVIDLVAVDPSGRYACLADDYDEAASYGGGFTIRPERGDNVIDLSSGESVGEDCAALTAAGYLSRDDDQIAFAAYGGETAWEAELPVEIANSPNLFYFGSGDWLYRPGRPAKGFSVRRRAAV